MRAPIPLKRTPSWILNFWLDDDDGDDGDEDEEEVL